MTMDTTFRYRTLFSSIWIWAILAVAASLMAIAANRLDRLSYANYIQKVREATFFELLEVRESFESLVHSQSLVLRELATFISENPDMTQEEFSRRVRSIRGTDVSTVSMAAAPNLVITLIHPVEGNEGALGLDYRTNAEQFPVVQELLKNGGEMVTGPVNLAQGGLGLILRAPVYVATPETPAVGDGIDGGAWGIVSLVLDYEQFLGKAGILAASDDYDLLIEVVSHSADTEGAFFYGDMALKDRDPVTLNFDFEFEDWKLHAVTKGGWPQTSPNQWQERLFMALVALALLLLLIYIIWLADSRKRAEVLLVNGIEALADGFVMFDADDRLIVNNTKYKDIYGFPKEALRHGTPFQDYVHTGALGSDFFLKPEDRKSWLEIRRQSRLDGKSLDHEQHLADGRVIRVSDRRMRDGSYVGLRVDITELSNAKAAAEAASKAKTDFMGVLSHELRTPLTVILGVARLTNNARLLGTSKAVLNAVERDDISPEETKALLDGMFDQLSGMMDRLIHSGDHLLHLINEMLDVAKIEAGSLTVDRAICDIDDIVTPVTQQLMTLSRDKGLDLVVSEDQGAVWADVVRARQILMNLLGNAIKFTEQGQVRLSVQVKEDTVLFEVKDTGPGIAEAELESIFEVFYQVDSTETRRAGGTGMGLAISRDLAKLQGGSLTVTSTLGEGSCFVLTLPSASACSDPKSDAEVRD